MIKSRSGSAHFNLFFWPKNLSCILLNKIKAIFFLVSFLLANSGMVVSAHWCGGKLAGISFFSVRDLCACAKKNVAMKRGCCEAKVTTFQSDNDLDVTGPLVYKAPSSELVAFIYLSSEAGTLSSAALSAAAFSKPPPGHPKIPRYMQNRVFRI